MMDAEPGPISQEERYQRAALHYGPAIERLARGYEADPELRRDLVQEIHVALWRSFAGYDGRCSERTWVYRVAHNVAVDYVRSRRRTESAPLVDLEDAAAIPIVIDVESQLDAQQINERLSALVRELRPTDRQVILLYLDDLSAAEIAEISGLTSGAVAVRIHRIKALLAERFSRKDRS